MNVRGLVPAWATDTVELKSRHEGRWALNWYWPTGRMSGTDCGSGPLRLTIPSDERVNVAPDDALRALISSVPQGRGVSDTRSEAPARSNTTWSLVAD